MKTLILPGYSIGNKEEAEKIKKDLPSDFEVVLWNWPHWETGHSETGWLEIEAEKIITTLKQEPVNIVAKSIGTAVAMILLKRIPHQIKKVVLCGIPIQDFLPGNDQYYEALDYPPAENVLCIQNENDNHGSYNTIERFVHNINPEIKVVSKPSSDHNYPYSEDITAFLKV